MISKPRQVALRISLLYTLMAGAWILLSDRLLAALVPDLETIKHLQLYKGLAFVGITTVLLHVLLRRAMGRWGRELDERARAEEKAQGAAQFTQSTIDALASHICVLDEKGTILTTNKAWQRFAELNPPVSHAVQTGANYLSVCTAAGPEDKDATAFAAGLRAVLRQEREHFEMEYSCHSPTEQRWFIARVTRFSSDGSLRVVVAHQNITLRKQAEESLKLFRTFVDKSNDAFEVIDPATGRFLDMSERGCADLGYRREEILALKVSDIDSTVQPAMWPQLVKKVGNEKAMTYEGIHRRKDGTTFPVEVTVRCIHLEREYLVAVVRDITERRETQDKLLASELRYRRLFESAKDGILILDAGTGMVVDVNPFLIELLGFSREAFLGKKVWELGFLKDIVANQENFAELQRKEYIRYENLPLETADGRRIAVEFVSNVYQVNSHKVIQCNIRDITKRRRAEEKLRETNEYLANLFNYASAPIFVWDPQFRITRFNRAFEALTGRPGREILGKPLEMLFPPAAVESSMALVKKTTEGKRWESIEVPILHHDGTVRAVLWNSATIFDEGRKTPVAVIAQGQDITERKRAEQLVADALNFNQTLLAASPVGIISYTAEGQCVSANKAAARLVGGTVEQLQAQNFRHVESWKRSGLLPAAEEALKTGREQEFEVRLLTTFGKGVWLTWRFVPFQHEGTPHLLAVFEDVAERKRAAAELHRSTELLQLVLDNIPAFVFWKDREFRYLGCNKRFAELAGAEQPSAFVGKTDYELAWRASADLYRADDRQVMETNTPKLDYEEPQVRPDGTTHWLKTSKTPLPDADGKVFGVLGIFMDITERKQAEAQLQLQGAALKAAANAIVITDAQGIILWVNDAFTKVTGYPAGEAIGKNPRVLKSGKHPREFYEGLWKTILGGHVWHGEINNKRKDGTDYTEDMTITPVRDAQGKITHFIGIKQDITEKLQLQLRLLRAQRLEGIGLLAGGIAHDLNNVLAPILMSTGLLRSEPISTEGQEILTGLETSAQRGADIVRQVLTFARGVEGERVAVQVRHLIKDMMHIMGETFPKDIRLEQDVAKDLWLIKGDATQIHQILLNLCINARDAMPTGGTLRLEARNQNVDEGFASMMHDARPGNYVVVTISDTGTGMAPAVIDHIFEPFFSTKERGKGTGLGLSTVSGIVRSHGGFIQVKSEVGRGSQFIVFLPTATKETFFAPDTAGAAEFPRGNGELILLVDDEKPIRDVAKGMLTQYGYRVLVAVDGMDGMVLYAKHGDDIALVLTDILMPFMDGAGMARAILRLNPGARILVSTGATVGGGVEGKLEELKQMGITTVLLKPYSNTTLLREVQKALHPPDVNNPA